MSTSNLHLVLCHYSNNLVYCLKVSPTHEERNFSLSPILGTSSFENIAHSPKVINRCLRGCCENKNSHQRGEVPTLSTPHTSTPRPIFYPLHLCKICLNSMIELMSKKVKTTVLFNQLKWYFVINYLDNHNSAGLILCINDEFEKVCLKP